jgi:transposase
MRWLIWSPGGLEHRVLGAIRAIGVDEIQYGKGHNYLTLVYQIDLGCTRLLWIGKERTVKTFKEFFTMIGPEVSAKIEFVCSDMWKPYLNVDPPKVLSSPQYPRPVSHGCQGEQGGR